LRKFVLESKVKGLCGEVTDHVGEIASPEGHNTFFFDAFRETISDSIVATFCYQSWVYVLGLEQKFHSFNGGDQCLGDRSRNTSHGEIDNEIFTHICLMRGILYLKL
jgi:hypothetical protein